MDDHYLRNITFVFPVFGYLASLIELQWGLLSPESIISFCSQMEEEGLIVIAINIGWCYDDLHYILRRAYGFEAVRVYAYADGTPCPEGYFALPEDLMACLSLIPASTTFDVWSRDDPDSTYLQLGTLYKTMRHECTALPVNMSGLSRDQNEYIFSADYCDLEKNSAPDAATNFQKTQGKLPRTG